MCREENPYRSPDGALDGDAGSDAECVLINRGRWLFAAFILFYVLAIEILLTLSIGGELDYIRLALTLALFAFAWRGHGWAVFLMVLCFGGGAILAGVFAILFLKKNLPVPAFLLGTMGIIYAATAFALIFSKSLRAFFKHQAAQRRPHSDRAIVGLMTNGQPVDNDTGFTTVAVFGHRALADTCRQMLEDEGIKAFVINDQTGAGFNIPVSNALAAKVQVATGDAERGRELIKAIESPSPGDQSNDEDDVEFACEDCGGLIRLPSHMRGRVEVCPHCREYVDVPERNEPHDS